jgi:hypothetical protein
VCIAVDNVDIRDNVRDQRTGDTLTTHHLTSGLIFINKEAPPRRHQQHEFHRSERLREGPFTKTLTTTWHCIGSGADQFFTWNALVGSLGLSETKTLEIRKDRRGINAFKCRLKTGRTTIYPLKGMYLNSGTTDGAAQVQLECLRQLGFSTNDSDGNPLNQILIPYIGDQKTIEMARVGRDDQTDSGSAVHRRNWLLLIPALFHVSMNFAQDLMERTHWAPTDIQEDPDFKGKGKASEMRTFSLHTIQSDSILLQYKDISADTLHFSKLDALLRMSFNARLTACLIWVCHRQGFIRSDNPTSEEVKTSLSRLRDDQFDSCTSEVHEMLFSSHAWNGEYRDPRTKAILPASSNSFITLCRFMQQLRTYFTFREAVRQGDINKIETLLPLLAVLFFGANKHKYGTEMLWLHWLLSSTICTPELRRTIRGCLIVKQTKESNYTGVDHAVELGNLAIKTDLKHFKNSTHTIETTIGTNSLTSSYMKELRLGLEEPLGIKYNPGHTVKDVVPDTFALISSILADKKMGIVPVSKETGQNKRKQFVSEDILKQGYTKIFDKIKDFNQRCVDDKTRGAPTPFDEPAVMETDSNETEIAIQREERVKWNAGLTLDEE